MVNLTFYGQFPVRSQTPTVPAVAVLKVDGIETVVGQAQTLGNLRKNSAAIYKLIGKSPADVTFQEFGDKARKDWMELPTMLDVDDQPQAASSFTVGRRFELMTKGVRVTAIGRNYAAIIVGQGGLGKSFTVERTLKEDLGMAIDDPMIEAPINFGNNANEGVIMVRGNITEQGLYKVLHNHRNQMIVFDDADGILESENKVNMLKAILDSRPVRKVSWVSGRLADDGWETTFEFTGRVIYISNRTFDRMPQSLHSRCLLMDLTLSEKEIFDRIRDLGKMETFAIVLPYEAVDEIVEELYARRRQLKDLSLRTYIKAAGFYIDEHADWKDMVRFCL